MTFGSCLKIVIFASSDPIVPARPTNGSRPSSIQRPEALPRGGAPQITGNPAAPRYKELTLFRGE